MNKDKLILKNGSEIEIESGATISNIQVISDTKESMVATWNLFTPENLKNVNIQNGDGTQIAEYENVILDSETSIVQKDGKIITGFRLRQKTEIELIRDRIVALENAQEVQDGAITDLGAAVSGLAEEGGLA